MSTNTDNSETSQVHVAPILPRSAWNSQFAYFKVVFKAKKALDRIEQAAGIKNNYS